MFHFSAVFSSIKKQEGKCSVMIRISLNGKMCNIGSSGLFKVCVATIRLVPLTTGETYC